MVLDVRTHLVHSTRVVQLAKLRSEGPYEDVVRNFGMRPGFEENGIGSLFMHTILEEIVYEKGVVLVEGGFEI